jgi:hypothetical protein
VTGPAGGGASSLSITGFTGYGAIMTIATGGTGLAGISTLTYNSNTNMLTAGAITLANGYRPLYQRITSGTSITPAASSYGTHYDINTSAISSIIISYPATGATNWSNDSNGYWVFRNNTGSYVTISITYSNAAANIYPTSFVIPPGNSTTFMATYPGGGANSNYVLF